MVRSLPRFIVLKTDKNGKYLSYIQNHKEIPGFLQFSGEEVVSPHCKFQVEPAESVEDEGLVHIRCCYNNKYWVCPENTHRIVAQAHEKEEDTSKWSCTLFKPRVFPSGHVHLCNVSHGHNASWWNAESPNNDCLYSGKSINSLADYLTFVDWETLVILPKHITFKDAEGSYLGAREVDGRMYLKFQGTNIEDPTIGHQVFNTPDGNIRIKSDYTGKFWRRSPNWIWPDSTDTTNSDLNTLFSVTRVKDNTIALRNLGNNEFCKTLSTEGKEYCLNASADTIWKDVHLLVEEFVKTREIYNVRFHLKDARMYNESIVHNSTQTNSNWNSNPNKVTLQFKYTTEESQNWNSSVSLKFGFETSITAGIPCIGEGQIKMSAEVESNFEWGTAKSNSFEITSTHEVEVPAMTEVMVNLQAKKASCDIPYSYSQRDTLTNGEVVTHDMDDGIYTGINTFNFECQVAEAIPLVSTKKEDKKTSRPLPQKPSYSQQQLYERI